MAISLPLLALKVLILAGGGTAKDNHHSHLTHVQRLQSLLAERGVAPADVAVFWADGQAPTPDRAVVAEAPHPDAWLLGAPHLERLTAPGPELVDTRLPGARPANRIALKAWLEEVGPTLRPGDTLLVAVTDHGEPDPEGGFDTRITLWGDTRWSVSEVMADLEAVPEDVRVVFWASQCHSGGFADLRRRANTCGAFSATADRVAYGCYPQLAAREDVGHFLRMSEGISRWGALAPASDEAMLTDDTPDVPHLTSDAFAWERVSAAADKAGAPLETFLDDRLPEADPDATEHALIAGITSRYGLGPLSGYGRTADVLDALARARYAAETWQHIWSSTLEQALERIGERVIRATPERRARAGRLRAQAAARTAMRRLMDAQPERAERVAQLFTRVRRAEALLARVAVQEAAALRVAYLQARLVAPQLLDRDDRRHLAELLTCERETVIPGAAEPVAVAPRRPMPGVGVADGEAATLRPGWFGIRYRDRRGGAVEITGFEPGSPLLVAGLAVGDVIEAVGGWRLERPGDLRLAVVLAAPGAPLELRLRSGRKGRALTVYPAPAPLPPPPPALGQMMPTLGLVAHRDGPLPAIGEGRPVVLFFWSAACKPCRRAAPALQAWAEKAGADVIAVTREGAGTIDRFVKRAARQKAPFPFPIARDPSGEAHRLTVAGGETPFFALIGPHRRLITWGRGFTGQIPLEVEPAGAQPD